MEIHSRGEMSLVPIYMHRLIIKVIVNFQFRKLPTLTKLSTFVNLLTHSVAVIEK
jgi:hypothetical protein